MLDRIPFLGFSEPISSLTHLLTAIFFLILGSKMLWNSRGNNKRVLSLFIYYFCCIFLFSMSGVYHLLEKGTTGNYVLQILDHAGIYLMISGSFTPFQIILLRRFQRWIPLSVIWILSITGLTLTAIFFDTMPEWLLLSFFIAMGWMSLFTVLFIKKIAPQTVKYIFIGGVLYTLGAIADFTRWPQLFTGVLEAHEVFHLFVSAAALVHFYAINKISKMPVSDVLTIHIKEYPSCFKAYPTSENFFIQAKTEEELREKIREWIENEYLSIFKPRQIKLKFFKEDHL